MMVQSLERQIEAERVKVSADSVSMSITELTNLYKEGVLQIRPEFQRLFRWTNTQKSKLVESLLLGIPLPSLFVSQAADGSWELVDGLQRVSTLLELQGLLPAEGGGLRPPLVLSGTKFLTALKDHTWDGEAGQPRLSAAQQLDIRLSRLDIKVIRRSSDPRTKFDLFQRLNSFGSALTAQEIRSAMMAGTNSDSLAWLTRCAENPDFKTCISLAERLRDEQYDLELVLRFLMLHQMQHPARKALSDFPGKLDDWAVELASEFKSRRSRYQRVFDETFRYLASSGGEDLFRRWDTSRQAFRGAFLNTSYEIIAIGAGHLIAHSKPVRIDPSEAAKELSSALDQSSRFATGLATADRLVKTLPLGRRLMADPPAEISPSDFA